MALVALRTDPATGIPEMIAIGRLTKSPDGASAEIALLVSDAFQGRGLGANLMKRLIGLARDEGLKELEALTLLDNDPMCKLLEKFGFRFGKPETDGSVNARLLL
jgi:acetyltransferase